MADNLTILVVDDNKEFRENVRDILEMKGHQVQTAPDGFKALELAKQTSFDLVIMDVKMPAMNGVQTFKKIRRMAPQTPVIMVTAYAVEELVKEALREGAFGFMKKPLDFEQLFTEIENARLNGALILVVDDDRSLCANLKDVLSDKGYRVTVAYDGKDAVEKAWENNFDVMLIDMRLPPLNGLETYLAIRDVRPNTVAIIITGYRQELASLVDRTLESKAYACLEKPIDMEALASLLERTMEEKRKGLPGNR